MSKNKLAVSFAMIILLAITASGCALVSTAISAAAAYGIYQATKR